MFIHVDFKTVIKTVFKKATMILVEQLSRVILISIIVCTLHPVNAEYFDKEFFKHIKEPMVELVDVTETDMLVDNRPGGSRVVATLSPPLAHGLFYQEKDITYWTDWMYCDGNAFIAGVEATEILSKTHNVWEPTRFRFPCETIEGQYTNDVFVGTGNEGEKNPAKGSSLCNSISNHIIVNYTASANWNTMFDFYCATIIPKSLSLVCLAAGDAEFYAKYERSETKSGPFINRHYICPPFTALCGVRAQLLKYMKSTKDCPQSDGYWTKAWRPHILHLEFACCKIIMPENSCDSNLFWKTKITCRKGLHCTTKITSEFTRINTNSNETDRSQTFSANVEAEGEAVIEGVLIGMSTKYSHKGVDGRTITDILKKTSKNESTIVVDMGGCVGSLQQLVIDCGEYRASTKHFRCLETIED